VTLPCGMVMLQCGGPFRATILRGGFVAQNFPRHQSPKGDTQCRKQNMTETARLFSIHGLSVELGLHRTTVAAALRHIPPDGRVDGRGAGWRLLTALPHLAPRAIGGTGEGLDLQAEQARKAKQEADRLELQNGLTRGDLVQRAAVDDAVVAAFTRVKAKALAIPTKLAPVLSTVNDPDEARALLCDAVAEVLGELCCLGSGA
jgi:hypothetical protein